MPPPLPPSTLSKGGNNDLLDVGHDDVAMPDEAGPPNGGIPSPTVNVHGRPMVLMLWLASGESIFCLGPQLSGWDWGGHISSIFKQ